MPSCVVISFLEYLVSRFDLTSVTFLPAICRNSCQTKNNKYEKTPRKAENRDNKYGCLLYLKSFDTLQKLTAFPSKHGTKNDIYTSRQGRSRSCLVCNACLTGHMRCCRQKFSYKLSEYNTASPGWAEVSPASAKHLTRNGERDARSSDDVEEGSKVTPGNTCWLDLVHALQKADAMVERFAEYCGQEIGQMLAIMLLLAACFL